jgi:hypothetical protein
MGSSMLLTYGVAGVFVQVWPMWERSRRECGLRPARGIHIVLGLSMLLTYGVAGGVCAGVANVGKIQKGVRAQACKRH